MGFGDWIVKKEAQQLVKLYETTANKMLEPEEKIIGFIASYENIGSTAKQYWHLFCFTTRNVIVFVDEGLIKALFTEPERIVSYDRVEIGVRKVLLIQKRPFIKVQLPNGKTLTSDLTWDDYKQVETILADKAHKN